MKKQSPRRNGHDPNQSEFGIIWQLEAYPLDDPEGGKAEQSKPHKNPIHLFTGSLTEAEQKQNEKIMLEELKKKMKR